MLSFDEAQIQSLLQRSHQPYIDPLRPSVLLWIAQEQADGRRTLVGPDSTVGQWLNDQAKQLGIALLWPQQQPNKLQFSAPKTADLWGLYADSLLAASQPYQTELVLAGRLISDDDGRAHSSWLLLSQYQDQPVRHTLAEDLLPTHIACALDTVMKHLLDHYAIDLSQPAQHTFTLQISGITSIQDHGAVQHYLQALPGLAQLQLTQLDSQQAHYSLRSRLSANAWQRMMRLRPSLQPRNRLMTVSEPFTATALPESTDHLTLTAEPIDAPNSSLFQYHWRPEVNNVID